MAAKQASQLSHKPECDLCGEPAVATYRREGKTINRCFDCLGDKLDTKKQKDDKLLRALGLL